ncbi:MAG: HRDC domain-containing protein [Holosporaceae bacterium]|nr:HRDC domain-containing protein [Holosporaceae bacterium]
MLLVDTKNSLDNCLQNLRNERIIAVDTEFIREKLDKPLLCLIQIAALQDVFLIDPTAVDISPLNNIFNDENVKKVFHAARQDLEILSLHGINTKNFYDTQLYESILSENDNISYQSLILRYLGKKLKKNYSMSDWTKRPLSKKQLIYSSNDVFYLREAYQKQFHKLTELNRENWLNDELLRMTQKKEEEDNFASTLNKNNREIYNQLQKWRTDKAAEKNISPTSIVKDEILKTICQKGTDFILNLKNSRNTKDENYRQFLFFAEKISDGLEIQEKSEGKNPILDLLKTLLYFKSQQHSVAPSIVATVKDLNKLIGGENNLKCLSGWRNEIFGRDAILLLNGKISLRINKSQVIVE